jgi:hypothetical protein
MWELLQQSRSLVIVARGMIGYSGATRFPAQWEVGSRMTIRPSLRGRLKLRDIDVHYTRVDPENMTIVTTASSRYVKKWEQTRQVIPISENRCRYVDTIEVEGALGVLTPIAGCYALSYCVREHKRWPEYIERELRKAQS